MCNIRPHLYYNSESPPLFLGLNIRCAFEYFSILDRTHIFYQELYEYLKKL